MNNILITGGTGFFGQGMVRHLLTKPWAERICIFSRDEAKQAMMRAQIADPNRRLHWFIGDVRDRARLTRAMNQVHTVIHAAALKRVEVGEYNPGEMVKTNVLGAMNVIEAATDAGVRHVVALSSDKACQPRNGYGASKLMMEKLILGANNARGMTGPRFACTRYGNVANSTGSVIPTWRAAIEAGRRPIITDPDATRFWMTLQEAIDLVLNTAETMNGGELVIPDLPAYRLGDLLGVLPRKVQDLPTAEHVGLGPGEKLHERMKEDGPDSSQVRRMTVDELREALRQI